MATSFSTAVEAFRSRPPPSDFQRSKRKILKGAFDEVVERLFSKDRRYEKIEENQGHAGRTATQPSKKEQPSLAGSTSSYFADRGYPTRVELCQKYPDLPTEEQLQSILMDIRDEAEALKQRERSLTAGQLRKAQEEEDEKYAHLKVEDMDEEVLKGSEVNPFRFLGLVLIRFGDSCDPGKNYSTGNWHLKAPRKLKEEEKEWCSERLSSVIQIPEVTGSWIRRNPNECFYERKSDLLPSPGN
ncbi:hypothetical protein B0T20DRAFT_174342 [Sordaria brevicollis]|uniref:Uncharacterized protein n=1 Tax=Sordaria brevicollis TaxID=83679 RepID=A0AAE0PHC0_SORBR|nr:hypothetical protein B0T20DRAFT_174342 [Sordaria brevicollis]